MKPALSNNRLTTTIISNRASNAKREEDGVTSRGSFHKETDKANPSTPGYPPDKQRNSFIDLKEVGLVS